MSSRELRVYELEAIDLWVTQDVAIFKQETMFCDTDKSYQFVPAGQQGFVIATKSGAAIGGIPLQANVLYRPATLVLRWNSDKVVNFRYISKNDAIDWFAAKRRAFKLIGKEPK